MRDQNRIRRIIEKLYGVWIARPDLRLGQLLLNIDSVKDGGKDIFYIEDNVWEKKIDHYSKKSGYVDYVEAEVIKEKGEK